MKAAASIAILEQFAKNRPRVTSIPRFSAQQGAQRHNNGSAQNLKAVGHQIRGYHVIDLGELFYFLIHLGNPRACFTISLYCPLSHSQTD